MDAIWKAQVAIGARDARERIRDWLEVDPAFVVEGVHADPAAAIGALDRGPSELLVLDADLPDPAVIDWVRKRPRRSLPVLILLSSRSEGAELAFDLEAVDFLRRPLDESRFSLAKERAKRAIRLRATGATAANGAPARRTNGHLRRFVIREVGRIFFVDVDRVDWMKSAGNYLELHTPDGMHLMRESLVALEQRLDPDRFVRISRSAMVNLECVRELKPEARGGYRVLLRDGTVLKLSRRYRDRLETTL